MPILRNRHNDGEGAKRLASLLSALLLGGAFCLGLVAFDQQGVPFLRDVIAMNGIAAASGETDVTQIPTIAFTAGAVALFIFSRLVRRWGKARSYDHPCA